jgi:D-alanyl-lipoteichoic acid acyltransferase DltB (MBOAT superfamily)
MALISLEFLAFATLVLGVYYLLPGKLQNPFLLLASYAFYLTWDWQYAVILLAITGVNFFWGLWLEKTERQKCAPLLRAGVILNLLVFGIFLFAKFYNQPLTGLLASLGAKNLVVNILLPVGFSYYILECISYLTDIHHRLVKATPDFLEFALYLAYFPKLLSGPIERARSFLPQLREAKTITAETFQRSVHLILVGVVRSVVLGGLCSLFFPTNAFTDPLSYSSTELVLAVALIGFTIYNLFAGYSNVARGVSLLFGIDLNRNFAQPFFAKDFSDFWMRWHNSLSMWLRDYIYLPVSRALLRRNLKQTNLENLVLPPLVTLLASGIWHGASPNLLVWGLVMGVYVIAENVLNLFRRAAPAKPTRPWRRVLASVVVSGLAILSAIPFQFNLPTGKIIVYGIIKRVEFSPPDLVPLLIIAASLLLDWIHYHYQDEFVFLRCRRGVRIALVPLACFAILVVSNLLTVPTTFIYP